MTFSRRLLLAAAVALFATAGSGCDFNLDDPNSVGEDTVFNTTEGLLVAAIGLQELYNVQTLDDVVIYPAITTRELAANTTFANLLELEEGGPTLNNTNGNVGTLFGQLYRVLGYAESIGAGAQTVSTLTAEQRAGLSALASFYRAVALGTLAQNFEQVALATDFDGQATYSSNDAAFEEAARLLGDAETALTGTAGAAGAIPTPAGFDLLNTVRAYRARYELFAGNDQAAIDAANRVDAGATSVFVYSSDARNPLFVQLIEGNSSYIARDNLGLAQIDPADGRVAFYTDTLSVLSTNGFPADAIAGFPAGGSAATQPAFLPGELALIRAEALVNLNRLDDAVDEIDAVRTKEAADDPFGVGAGLPAYSGAVTAAALRAEIFVQRSAELYLQGLRLADSRRLGGQSVGTGPFERTRTFYPYPFQERNTNDNTPADPAI